MKKNFFKKLALVMALALTITSVPATSASAATAPGFKSKSVKLNVDQTKKYSTANSKKYSVKFKIGNKKVATIASSKGSKSVKVTGVASGKTTLRADFKSYKTKKVTTARVSVTVAEVATTLTSVEAKGVKTIVATFNKAVDTTKAVIAVKKGNAKPSVATTVFADDKKSVTITMGSRLSEGTYDVSITGLTDAALTGAVTVQDETLTSIEIVGTNLVAEPKDNNGTSVNKATIAFKTVNQYGERMSVSNPNVSSSFGTASVDKACTTTTTGIILVKDIPVTLQVIGTSGSVTVVDTTKGINATATVTYSATATAKTMTIAGLYNVSNAKFEDMTKGDTVADYVVLATVEDQYGNSLSSKQLNGKVTANLVPGGSVTGIGTWFDKTVDGKDYVALPLTGTEKAKAGTFYFTFVNPTLGLLANTSFVVNAGTLIKSLSISATDTIYQGQDNTLSFEAIDTDGNSVTKYSTLDDLVKFSINSTVGTVKFTKNADGTAKLIFNPTNTLDGTYNATGLKKSTISSFTASANDTTSTNFFVKSLTFTAYQKRIAKAVTGLKTGTATAVASGQSFKLYASDLVVEDQYSNVMSDDEVKALKTINVATSATDTPAVGNITVSAATFPSSIDNHYVTLTAAADTNAITTLKLGIGNTTDYTVSLNTVDPMKATNLIVKSVNDDNVVKSVDAGLVKTDKKVVVTGTVAGKTVEIPASQYVVSGNTGYNLGTASAVNPASTVTGTVEVTVDTNDGSVVITKDYSFSNASSTVAKIEAKESSTLPTSATLTAANLSSLFTIKDQYGVVYTGSDVKYEVVDLKNTTSRTINHNNTNSISVLGVVAGDKFSVTASYDTITATKTVDMN
ncbi:MAG: hypothetical protein ACERKN_03590 [Velocimicrobium sp.]